MGNNKVREFLNEMFGEVRVLDQNGELWFVASDIAKILEYRDSNAMTRILDNDEKGTRITCTLGGNQKMTMINENGLHDMLSRTRKIDISTKKEIYKWLTNKDYFDKITSKTAEREFIKILNESIKYFTNEIKDWNNDFFDYIEQYKVLNYKIDIFF